MEHFIVGMKLDCLVSAILAAIHELNERSNAVRPPHVLD